eukprot:m.192254 g.192254  ORF g.192254 m.192254 type:complete len:142 (+) comp16765_c0_seq7:1630-2055(+)
MKHVLRIGMFFFSLSPASPCSCCVFVASTLLFLGNNSINIINRLLETAQKELEAKQQQQATLHQALEDAEAIQVDLEKKYSSLEEEMADKKDKIKKLYDQYMSLKAERDDTRNDYEGQVTGLHYDSLLTIIILCAFWALCY